MESLLYWVWLSRVFSYGSSKPRELLSFFDSAEDIFKATKQQLQELKILKKSDIELVKSTSIEVAEKIIDDCKNKQINIIAYNQEEYPIRLKNIINPPMVIYSVGDISEMNEDVCLCVVGTRNASEYGQRLTGNLCYELAKAGVVIVSGCAVGIDTFAHLGALKAGGKTIGVLACGIDVDYPAKSHDLKLAMLKKGALISELPPGENATRNIFKVRNRIMSALCNGVMVTEAPKKSGALITAEHAIEQGRDLFCVPPHDIYNENFAGVSKYIRDGATSVCSAKDILVEYINAYPHKLNYEMIFSDFVKSKFNSKREFNLKVTNTKSEKTTKKVDTSVIIENKSNLIISNKNIKPVKDTEKEQTVAPKIQEQEPEEFVEVTVEILDKYGDSYVRTYSALSKEPITIEDLVSELDLPTNKVMAILTELELMNMVNSYSGGRFSKK